jgi:hypothetical protein
MHFSEEFQSGRGEVMMPWVCLDDCGSFAFLDLAPDQDVSFPWQ